MKYHSIFPMFLLIIFPAIFPAYSATIGDYRTKASGNWNQVSIWEYYNGSSWISASATPSYTDNNIDIRSGYVVALTASVTADQLGVAGSLTINAGITLTINDGTSTDMSVGGLVYVFGTLVNNGTISSSTSEMYFYNGSLYRHNHNGGSIPGATWNDGSACEVTGVTSSTSISNTDQSFYNFTWNCTAQTAETNCSGNLQTIRGNFTMISTGTSGKLKLGETADYTLNITGNWDHQGGTLNMGGGSSNGYINLTGNFSMSAGKITETNSSGIISKITFVKAGVQIYTKSGGTFENNIDFEIAGGTTLDAGTSIVDGSLGQFSVSSGGTLKTSNLNGIASSGASGSIQTSSRYYSFAANYQFCRTGVQATGNGIPSPLNGKLIIGSATDATNLTLTNGSITIDGTLILCSSNLTNSTIPSGTVYYGSSGTLEYQGMTGQTTTIKEWPVTSPPYNVTINNGYGIILDAGRSLGGAFTLSAGSFSIGTNTLTLNGSLVKTSGTLTGGTGSNVIVGGTSPTALDLPDVTLNNLLISRSSGIRLTGNVTIYGTMTMNNGTVTLVYPKVMAYMPGSRLKYNATASQVTAAEEFPASGGPPSLEVDKPAGTTLTLAFTRTLTDNLYLTSGGFSIGSNTLTLNGLITRTSGSLTGGSSSNIIFSGTGTFTTLPPVNLNDLTINRALGIYLGGDVTVAGTLTLSQGNLFIEGNTCTLNGAVSQTAGNLSGLPSSTIIFGPSPNATILPGISLGTLQINRSAGIQMNGNVEVGTNLLLTSGSLAILTNTLSLYSSLTLAGGGLTGTSASTLVVGGTTPAMSLPGLTVGTLTVSRPAGVYFTSDVTVYTALTLNSGACSIGTHLLSLFGAVQYNGGTMEGGSSSAIFVGGTGSALDLNPITLQSLTLSRANGINLQGTVTIFDLFTLMSGTVNRNGNSFYGPNTTLRYQGTVAQTTSDGEFPENSGPYSVEVMNPAGVALHADRDIAGDLRLTSGSFSFQNRTFSLGGTILQTGGSLQGGSTGNLVFTTGFSGAQLPAVTLNNLTIDRSSGVTMTGDCMVNGVLSLQNGYFTVGSGWMLRLFGFPIAGNPLNLKTNSLSSLEFSGSQPGHKVPASVTDIGNLFVNNPTGVETADNLNLFSMLNVKGYLMMGDHIVSGTGMFIINPGGKVAIGHPDGVSGNIQVSGMVLINSKSDWIFNGLSSQVTNFLPTTIPNTIRNLTISNASPAKVTLNSDLTLTGSLTIVPGASMTIDVPDTLTVDNDVSIN